MSYTKVILNLNCLFIFRGNILITIILSAIIISINIYFVIHHTITNFTYSLTLLIGVITYSTIYLLMCGYLTLHLVISMLDDCSVLHRNPVSIIILVFIHFTLFSLLSCIAYSLMINLKNVF